MTLTILFGVTFLVAYIWDSTNTENVSSIALAVSAFMFSMSLLVDKKNNNTEPTAMDVYQGRTVLEITYRDSVAVDSTVVFKDNFNK